jgi:hypothetical protein
MSREVGSASLRPAIALPGVHGPRADVLVHVIFEFADLHGAGGHNQVLLGERRDDVGRGQSLRLRQAIIQIDHHLGLLAAIEIGDRGAGNRDELGA